jgi:hypothetical protein
MPGLPPPPPVPAPISTALKVKAEDSSYILISTRLHDVISPMTLIFIVTAEYLTTHNLVLKLYIRNMLLICGLFNNGVSISEL